MSLPSGYTRLEYIESTGTQYIDTGFIPNQDTRIDMVACPTSVADAGGGTGFIPYGSAQAYNSRAFECYTVSAQYEFNYGTTYKNIGNAAIGQKVVITHNKNNVSLSINDGPLLTMSFIYSSFTTPYTMTLFGTHRSSILCGQQKIYSCQIRDNGNLIRNFIPCKNTNGVVGLWDDVNSQFYQNVGTGSFIAGEIPKGTHKTLVNGTAYEVKGGKCLVNGTVYDIKKGRTLIGGTGYDITLPGIGIRVSTLSVGQSVYMKVNGTAKEFIVVHQGKPSSLYDDSCNGTWLLMKDIYERRQWHSSEVNKLESSTIHSYLNSTFLNLFDSNIKDSIKQVKIPYRKNGGYSGTDQSGANGLSAKIFLLSGYEVGWTTSDNDNFPQDGAKLSYFEAGTGTSANNKRIAKLNGFADNWWLRSPYIAYSGFVWYILSDGRYSSYYDVSYSYGIRPALILRSDALVDDKFNIIS